MYGNRRRRWLAMAALVLGGTAATVGVGHASSPGASLQASAAPTASVVSVAIPADVAYGWNDAYNAWLVVPGPGAQTQGSDGAMSMAQPWGGLVISHYDGTSTTPTVLCSALSNVTTWSVQPQQTYYDISCGGTWYRVTIHSGPTFKANPSSAIYDGAQWSTPAGALIDARWVSQGATWVFGSAQICHGPLVCSPTVAPGSGQVGIGVTAFTAQEISR